VLLPDALPSNRLLHENRFARTHNYASHRNEKH